MSTKGQGKTYQWLQDHLGYSGDYCLIWPFFRNPNGYGQMGYEGRPYWAHRFMCELVNGPAPSPLHEAAHSCGNGDGGCCHPKHLSWKTKSQNLLDCRVHGTQARNIHGNCGRLSPEQVQQIRDLKGKKTQVEIALMFGVHEPTIRDIYLGRTYARKGKIDHYTPEESAKLREAATRGLNIRQAAEYVGRPLNAIRSKAGKMGLKFKQQNARHGQ